MTPNTESQTPKGKDLEDLLDKEPHKNKPLRNLYEGTSTLRFRSDRKENLFSKSLSERILILPTFPTWESTDNIYYYNLLKNKGSAKRKVTFEQTITTPPSNLLSEKQPRY